MDASEVKRIVDERIEPMMRAVGIPHWRITVEYEPLDEGVAASCNLNDADYWRALITIDPMKVDNEAELVRFLRHELLHVLAAPFQLYRQVAQGGLGGDGEERLFRHAMEQHVTWLERGLTSHIGEA